jgi:hypothetical protein
MSFSVFTGLAVEKRIRPQKQGCCPTKRAKLSAYRGVSRNKGRWVGQIVCDKKLRYLRPASVICSAALLDHLRC